MGDFLDDGQCSMFAELNDQLPSDFEECLTDSAVGADRAGPVNDTAVNTAVGSLLASPSCSEPSSGRGAQQPRQDSNADGRASSPPIVIDDSQPGQCSTAQPQQPLQPADMVAGAYHMLYKVPIPVTQEHLSRLIGPYHNSDARKLNDEIVNISLDSMLRQHINIYRVLHRPKCFVFSSYFMGKLLKW
jgi:hypothetical protein